MTSVVVVLGSLVGLVGLGSIVALAGSSSPPKSPVPPPVPPLVPGAVRVSNSTISRIDRYAALFAAAARREGVPAAWLKGLCAAESDGNPDSGQGTSGYKGLMQCERTDDQLDPAVSIAAGARKVKDFMQSLSRRLGAFGLSFEGQDVWTRLAWTACAYNAGPGVVEKAAQLAHQAGDATRWREDTFYIPALVYYGAYSTRAYAKGYSDEDVAEAERWRSRVLKGQMLSAADLAAGTVLVDGAYKKVPSLVVLSVQQKAAHTQGYLDKILSYARFYADREAVA